MPRTDGVPVTENPRGVKHDVRKIDIGGDKRMAITGQIRSVLTRHPDEFDPRKYLKPAMDAMVAVGAMATRREFLRPVCWTRVRRSSQRAGSEGVMPQASN